MKTLGNLYLSRGEHQEAAGKYEQLIRLGVNEPEVYRNLAVALAGQKLYNFEAQQLYPWVLEKFPNDRTLCLLVAEALLHNNIQDELAQRCYEAALAHRPPFAKDLYLQLHHIFHRDGRFDNSFQALKQALYLEKTANDQLLMRLTQLGWHYNRLEELIMTLRFLLGNNETNPVIRRALAFSLAHHFIRLRHQEVDDLHSSLPNEGDLQLLHAFLPPPGSLNTLQAVRDYCTLRLAMAFFPKPEKLPPQAGSKTQQGAAQTYAPDTFEYRSLLDESPLEEVLAESESASPQSIGKTTGLLQDLTAFDWQRDLLAHLPSPEKPAPNDSALLEVDEESPIPFDINENVIAAHDVLKQESPEVLDKTENVESRWRSVLVVMPSLLQEEATTAGSSNHVPLIPFPQKLFDYLFECLRLAREQTRVFALTDGLLIFAAEPEILATVAIKLFQEVARDNLSVPAHQQIVLRAALYAKDQPVGNDNIAGLELLYYTLHLAQAEIYANPTLHDHAFAGMLKPGKSRPSRLLMNQNALQSVRGAQNPPAISLGQIYWGAPELHQEVYEAIWHNPLDYASEKQPYLLERFLVIEKLAERHAYGSYRGRDRSLERPVVLKALHPHVYVRLREDEIQLAGLIDSIRRIGRLEHPRIPLIYDMGAHNDIFYFVREYIEGESLAFRLLSNQSRKGNGAHGAALLPSEALNLIIALCRILHYAHRQEVYHCNLKPANIWLPNERSLVPIDHDQMPGHGAGLNPALWSETASSSWQNALNKISNGKAVNANYSSLFRHPVEVKVSDFFIPAFNESIEDNDRLRLESPSNDRGTHFGLSWWYMAPERLNRGPHSHPMEMGSATADIFSLGMILYECLCGEHPYAQLEASAVPIASADWNVAPPSTLNRDLPPICDEVVLQAIDKDPARRFQTVGEFEAALQKVLRELEALPAPSPLIDDAVSVVDETGRK